MPVIERLLIADGEDFVSRPVGSLHLTFEGLEGDRHAGATRPSDARTPWQAVVTAYDALGQLGFKRIANATAPQVRQAPGAR